MKFSEVDYNQLSSAIKQYYDFKKQHIEKVIFFQMGDFFEVFFEDAEYMAKVHGLTLTGKSAGLSEKIPMAGVPINFIDEYIPNVIADGKKVVLVEQVDGGDNKIMNRKITKIITAANYLDNQQMNKFIAVVYNFQNTYYLSYGDPILNDFYHGKTSKLEHIINELQNSNILEIININQSLPKDLIDQHKIIDIEIDERLELMEVDNILLEYFNYLNQGNKIIYNQFNTINFDLYLQFSDATIDALNLIPNKKNSEGSLFNTINFTNTAIGKRYLLYNILHPLIEVEELNERLNIVEYLNNDFILSKQICEELENIYDMERIISKISDHSANPKDLNRLKHSLIASSKIFELITNSQLNNFFHINIKIERLIEKINFLIKEDATTSLKEGNFINQNVSEQLDELRLLANNSADWFDEYLKEQQALINSKNLKLKFSKILGYFLEINNSFDGQLPKDYIEKQSLTNCRRFVTQKLIETEDKLKNATNQIIEIEKEFFSNLILELINNLDLLKSTSQLIAKIDFFNSLSILTKKFYLTRPSFNNEKEMNIQQGYHIVIKNLVENFIDNDTNINNNEFIYLITGPNMSGKSTFMRQNALIAIMAQIGSFVPAKSANLPIFDKIFTRIGAHDDLMQGSSTFMVEMQECAYALNNATENSLILLDELGRGTSTFDGMSLAASIIDYIARHIKCITFFSTHYHELAELDKEIDSIKNVFVDAKEEQGNILFLHKVKDGNAQQSYGISVAKLANLPFEVINNAKNFMQKLDKVELQQTKIEEENQVLLAIKSKLYNLNPDDLRPIEALNLIYEIKEIIDRDDN